MRFVTACGWTCTYKGQRDTRKTCAIGECPTTDGGNTTRDRDTRKRRATGECLLGNTLAACDDNSFQRRGDCTEYMPKCRVSCSV